MKISFQVLHNYTENPLKVIGHALHLTLQEDLLIEIDLRTSLDFITLKLQKQLQTGTTLTCFNIDIEPEQYDLTRYDKLKEGFKGRLKTTVGFQKLLKYIDENRTEEYIRYYKELAELEMKIREVFSYIFYNKYGLNGNDLFEEFDAKAVGSEEPKPDELDLRMENKFFYLTFSGYLKFEKPKDIQVKELIPLIQTKEDYEQLRAHLNSRGIVAEHHLDFLQAVKSKLDPIENVRNCIAHNRQIPNKAEQNYDKAKQELMKEIGDFWIRELQEAEQAYELTYADEFAYKKVERLLGQASWDEDSNEIVLTDYTIDNNPSHSFNNLENLKRFLIEQANESKDEYFPSNVEDREVYERLYNAEELVKVALQRHTKDLIILNWI